jgi:hypothetical protein
MQFWDIQETHVLGTLERRALPCAPSIALAKAVIRHTCVLRCTYAPHMW